MTIKCSLLVFTNTRRIFNLVDDEPTKIREMSSFRDEAKNHLLGRREEKRVGLGRVGGTRSE